MSHSKETPGSPGTPGAAFTPPAWLAGDQAPPAVPTVDASEDDFLPVANAEDFEWVDIPPECQDCGGIRFWWNPWGNHFCMTCHPPVQAQRALGDAKRCRRQPSAITTNELSHER